MTKQCVDFGWLAPAKTGFIVLGENVARAASSSSYRPWEFLPSSLSGETMAVKLLAAIGFSQTRVTFAPATKDIFGRSSSG